MEVELNKNERIDELQYKGLKIIQDTTGFCFGIDSVLLSDFAKGIRTGSEVVDLGTGNGIIGILLCGKTQLKHITGIEIQEDVAQMAQKSIKLNDLQDRFSIINSNINNIFKNGLLEKNKYDVVVTNPPYKAKGTGMVNPENKKLIARHEITASLSDFINTASLLLKDKGEFYMVHKPERLVDIIEILRKNKLEPKELRFIYSNKKSDATLILIKSIKCGNKFLKVLKPLFIYNENGKYTNEIKQIYNIGSEKKG